MSKGKMKTVLLLIVLLLALAVACNLLIDLSESKTDDDIQASETVDPYSAAEETQSELATLQPTPAATQSSSWQTLPPATAATTAPAASPTPAPTATPAATAEPVAADTVIDSGSFTSETGLPINVRADWTATVYDASTVKVTVSVYLLCYQIQTQALTDAVNVSVGEDYETEDAPAIENEDNVQVTTLLATTTHYVSLASGESNTFPVAVEYHYRGTYSGEELPVIECGGSITLSR